MFEYRKQQDDLRKTMLNAERVCIVTLVSRKAFKEAIAKKRLKEESESRKLALDEATQQELSALRKVL